MARVGTEADCERQEVEEMRGAIKAIRSTLFIITVLLIVIAIRL